MANNNFVVQNGLTVGPLTIDAATGSINTTGDVNITGNLGVSQIAKNDSSISINDTGTGSNVSIKIDGTVEHLLTSTQTTLGTGLDITGNLSVVGSTSFTGNVNPSANVTYSLGSRTQMWKDIFVGPGTLYVNGKAVIQDNSGTITFSTDANQNLQIATSGSGDLQFVTGTGAIALQGPIKVTAGKYFTSSDGNAIGFSNQIAVDSLTSKSANTDLVITAAGTGKVQVNDDMQVTGNLTVTGTTTSVNTSTLSVADNIIDLNSDVTTGTPTEDAGIRILRGDSPAVQLKWNETVDYWQLTNDGSTYANIVTTSGSASAQSLPSLTSFGTNGVTTVAQGGLTVAGNLTVQGTSVTISSATLSVQDPVINIHSPNDLAPLTVDDGADIGMKFHYYKGSDKAAFLGWQNSTGYLEWYDSGTDTGNVFTGTTQGTIKTGQFIAANTTTSTSTTTGALVVAGGAGIAGAVYIGGRTTSAGVTTSSTILASTNNTIDIGASGTTFATVYATTFSGVSTTAKYADLAENYQADTIYPYGTVVMFGGTAEVTVATADTTRVAGVISQNPAHLMNGGLQGAAVVPLALQGRVPCNVIGPVSKGDLMVSAGFGFAKANNNAGVGQVIGKALADFPSSTKGQIEVVVGRF